MRTQKINQNNYPQRPKQAFKQNVLVKVTVPSCEEISDLKFLEILTNLIGRIFDSGMMRSENMLRPIRKKIEPQDFEVYITDRTTPMADKYEQLLKHQLDKDTFYKEFADSPETQKLSINTADENFTYNEPEPPEDADIFGFSSLNYN